jgi:polar amino acid transport system substrate-binding protein
MEFLDEAKVPAGFDIDLAKAVAKEAGFEAEFRSVSWDGLFPGLEAGTFDAVASSVVIDDAWRTKYDFSDPYLNAGQVLVVPRGSSSHRLDDLRGRSVGVQTGAIGATVVANVLGSSSTRPYDTIARAFADLAAGKLAGVVAETPVAAQYVLRSPRYQGAFQIVGQPLTEENYGFVVKKGNSGLLGALNAALGRVKAGGTLTDLAAHWLR